MGRGIAKLLLASILLAPASAAAAADKPMIFGWSGYEQPEFHAEYLAKHGTAPDVAVFADEDEALTKMLAGFEPDVITFCTYSIGRWKEAGVLQPIDTARLSHWAEVIPSLIDAPDVRDAEGKVWMVPFAWGNTSVVFRTDLAPEYVGTNDVGILFDEKYKGRLAVMAGVDETLPILAHHKGLDIYSLDAAGMEALRALLTAQRPLLRFYSEDPTQLVNALASGEVVAAIAWNSDVLALKSQGVPVEYMRPKGGLLTWVCGLGLGAKAPHPDLALDAIDSLLSTTAGAWLIENWGFGHGNAQSFAAVPAERLAELGLPAGPAEIAAFLAEGLFSRPLPDKEALIKMYEEVRAGF